MVDPVPLPETLARKLRPILARAKLTGEQSQSFLRRCGEAAQFLSETKATEPAANTVEKLDRVASEAHRLLAALNSLGPVATSTFLAHWDYLAFGTSPPVELTAESVAKRGDEGQFLGAAWDIIADLEASAGYAASQCQPNRAVKIGDTNARALVLRIAAAYQAISGQRPPYSKGTWFPEFMEAFAQWDRIGLRCGRALVESVVRTMAP